MSVSFGRVVQRLRKLSSKRSSLDFSFSEMAAIVGEGAATPPPCIVSQRQAMSSTEDRASSPWHSALY